MSIDINTPDITVQTAQLGMDAETFLHTNLGRYLIERAEMEEDSLKDELFTLSAFDTEANQIVRNKIEVTRMFRQWIVETIEAGHMATDTLMSEEYE